MKARMMAKYTGSTHGEEVVIVLLGYCVTGLLGYWVTE